MAFPPVLLATEDWIEVMTRLDKHFGVDASLDPLLRSEILDYLKRNSVSEGGGRRGEELPRITTTLRFARKHRGAIRQWSRGELKSLSDCGNCHKESKSQ